MCSEGVLSAKKETRETRETREIRAIREIRETREMQEMMALLGKVLFSLVLLQEQTTIYLQFKLVVGHMQTRYPHLLMVIHGATVFQ